MKQYRYYDPKTCGFDFKGAMEDFSVRFVGRDMWTDFSWLHTKCRNDCQKSLSTLQKVFSRLLSFY